jgi:hypothetical protein
MARVVGYGPFSLWLIHKEGLCPSSGDINRLMMMYDAYSNWGSFRKEPGQEYPKPASVYEEFDDNGTNERCVYGP